MIDSPLVRFDKQKIIFQQNGQNKKGRGAGKAQIRMFHFILSLYFDLFNIDKV